MKLCIVTSRFYPQLVGSGTSAYVIAREMSKRGHDVTVLTDAALAKEHTGTKLEFNIRYIKSLEDFSLGDASFKKPLAGLSSEIKQLTPDIVHVCNFLPMLLVSIIRSCIECPVVFTFLNTPVIGKRTCGFFSEPELDTALASFIVSAGGYDKLVLGSKQYIQSAKALGAPAEKIVLSYLAPDVRSFDQDEDTEAKFPSLVATYFDQSLDAYSYILLPSRITAQKGIIEAIEALNTINKRAARPYKLVLTGMAKPFDTKYAALVRAKIDELAIGSQVLAPNSVIDRNHLGMFFKRAALVLVPSWYEGLGLAAIEAQYLGVPLAVSDTTGLNEVVQHGHNGVVFEAKNSDSMAESVLGVLEGEIDAQKLVKAAHKTVTKFSLGKHIGELEDIYHELVRTGRHVA